MTRNETMAKIWRGGWDVVEYSSNANLSTVTEIPHLLKDGTGIEEETPGEDGAGGRFLPAGKAASINVRSADLTATVYDDLKTAEEAETARHFRFIGIEGGVVIEDCEDAWNEFVGANVTSTLESTDVKVGIGSAKITVGVDAAVGILATEVISPAINLTTRKEVSLWIKSTVQTNAGDLQLLLDDSPNCATPLETLDIPALAAGVWTKVNLTLSNPAALTTVVSVGLKMAVDKGAFIVYVDQVLGVPNNAIVKNVIPQVEVDVKPSGAFIGRRIKGKAYSDQESNIIVVTV